MLRTGMESAIMKLVMPDTLKDKIKDMEKQAIMNALRECGWVQAKAARQLGITERMIGYKIKKYGIGIREVVHASDQPSAVSSQ